MEYGSALGAEDRTGIGFPVYGSNGVVGHHEAALVTGPGVIVGRKGSVGAVQWSDEDFWPIDTTYWVNPRVDLDLHWMFECLKLIGLESMDSSTGVPGLNRNDAYHILVSVPPLKEQRQISKVFDDVDKVIQSTEDIIVKYQEVHDGMAEDLIGSKYCDATANLGCYVKLAAQQINPREFTTELFAHYSIPAFDSVGGPYIEYGEQIGSGKIALSESALLVSKLNPRKMRVQIFARLNSIRSIASTEFMVYVPHVDDLDLHYLYHLLSSHRFARRLQAVATGTTNSHVRVKPSETLGWPVWVPSLSEQRRIARILDGIDDTTQANRRQLEKLRQLRSGLAADLFSGKVRTVKV